MIVTPTLIDPLSDTNAPPVQPTMLVPFIDDYDIDRDSGIVPNAEKP